MCRILCHSHYDKTDKRQGAEANVWISEERSKKKLEIHFIIRNSIKYYLENDTKEYYVDGEGRSRGRQGEWQIMFGWRTRTKEFTWKNEDLTEDRY